MINKEIAEYKVSENFKLQEFLPVSYFDGSKTLEQLLKLIDPKIFKIAQEVRNILGVSMTVNNKYRGGVFDFRGLRTPACKEYRIGSQHSVGRAFDFNIEKHDSEKIFNKLTQPQVWIRLEKLGATRLESFTATPNWFHIDCKPVKGIKLPVIVLP